MRHPGLGPGLVRWQRAVLPLTLITLGCPRWSRTSLNQLPFRRRIRTRGYRTLKLEHLIGVEPTSSALRERLPTIRRQVHNLVAQMGIEPTIGQVMSLMSAIARPRYNKCLPELRWKGLRPMSCDMRNKLVKAAGVEPATFRVQAGHSGL